jgi:hypothetical protein
LNSRNLRRTPITIEIMNRNRYLLAPHCWLLAGLVALVGCSGDRAPPVPPAAVESSEAEPILAHDSESEPAAPAEAKNPLVRGIQEVAEAIPWGDEPGVLDDLEYADEMLTRVKRENRDAIRQANRQVRLRGPGSPNIVLIVAPTLRPADLGCYGNTGAATPRIDAIAQAGVAFSQYRAPADESAYWRRLMTGSAAAGDLSADHRRHTLPAVMWDAGYSTYLIGDCTAGGVFGEADPLEFDFDDWLGVRDPAQRDEPFPSRVQVPGGAEVRIAANAGGARGVAAGEFYTRAAGAQLARLVRGRPFFLMLVYPPAAGDPEQFDEHLGALWTRLAELRMTNNTIVIVTGMGQPADSRAAMIVAAPRQKGKGTISDHAWSAEDMLPTLVQAVSARRRPGALEGDSAWRAIVDLAAAATSGNR